MKRRTLILLLSLLALITILRETGVLTVNFYNSRINMSNTSNWSDNNFIGDDSILCRPMAGDCIPTDISQISVVTFSPEGMFNTDKTRCEQLHIHLNSFNTGFSWLPLYKSFTFSAIATCSDGITIRKFKNGNPVCTHHQFSGLITLTGSITVTGFCSRLETKRLITNAMVKAIEEIGENKLREL